MKYVLALPKSKMGKKALAKKYEYQEEKHSVSNIYGYLLAWDVII